MHINISLRALSDTVFQQFLGTDTSETCIQLLLPEYFETDRGDHRKSNNLFGVLMCRIHNHSAISFPYESPNEAALLS